MKPWLLTVGLRLAACGAVTYLLWRAFGVFAFLFSAPLFGVALARPILDLLSGSWRTARQVALREIEGRHFAHHGVSLDILDMPDHFRWLSTADVRRIVPSLPGDTRLRHLFPQDVTPLDPPAKARIRAERLFDALAGSQRSETIRFRLWLQREVIFPAERLRSLDRGRAASPAQEDFEDSGRR